MKIVLVYDDYLSEKTIKYIKKEWKNNDLVILDGGPKVYKVNEEFEEILIEDYNSGK